jgi:Zn-dependent protease with chaperone function/type II secretory pathway pseudopilin PulG
MKDSIYPRDRALTALTLSIGVAIWCCVIAIVIHGAGSRGVGGHVGILAIVSIISFFSYLFARSASIAHFRGNAIEVSEQQLPDLHAQLERCCDTLSLDARPTLFIQNGNGVLNAFATWFLGRKYVILLSSVVDAMDSSSNGVRFYIGHELAHVIRHDNPVLALLRWPALRLPLLGAAFSRARETTCDLHGLACSDSRESAARSLAALSAGKKYWAAISLEGYRRQLDLGTGFWMSFHELIASYPWTVKRTIRVLDETPKMPRRNPFAYVLALFVPYAGRMGAGIGLLLYVYLVGVVAAIAIPAYQSYVARAALGAAVIESQHARDALGGYYEANKQIPSSLGTVGVNETLPSGLGLTLNSKGMVLVVRSKLGNLVFTPRDDGRGRVVWVCSAGEGVSPQKLPPSCR